jgi:aspartate/methionine/tyrosine aminotransferase
MKPIMKAHQFLTFTTPPNLQSAVAYGLGKDDAYFAGLSTDLEAKRDLLAEGLRKVGFEVLESAGTYFLNADFRPLGFNGPDDEFCKYITREAGVAAVPVSAFCEAGKISHLARFCFYKRQDMLEDACDRLARFFDGRGA